MRPWIQKLIDSGKLLGAISVRAIRGHQHVELRRDDAGRRSTTSTRRSQQLIEASRCRPAECDGHGGEAVARKLRQSADARRRWWWRRDGFVPSDGGGPGGATDRTGSAGTVVIQMDGRTVAQGVVPFIPGVVTRAGLTR